jgi:hypothetical protein
MKRIFSEIIEDLEFIRGHTLQPEWYRILKVFLLLGFLGGYYALFGGRKTLIFCAVFFGLAILLHLLYRSKTRKFTRSWLDFVVVYDDQGYRTYQRIGVPYYLAVTMDLLLAVFLSQSLL